MFLSGEGGVTFLVVFWGDFWWFFGGFWVLRVLWVLWVLWWVVILHYFSIIKFVNKLKKVFENFI
jgi:hypothetical protein